MSDGSLSCPVSRSVGGRCPVGSRSTTPSRSSSSNRVGPRGCAFSGYTQPGDVHAAFQIPRGVDAGEWLRNREQRAINDLLYTGIPSAKDTDKHTRATVDTLPVSEKDILAIALGAPARRVIQRAEETGPRTAWKDGHLTAEYGFVPPDSLDGSVRALRSCPGRVWAELADRMPGCVARGRVQEACEAIPLVEAEEDSESGMVLNVPDDALWAACIALGMISSICRYEQLHDGREGVAAEGGKPRATNVVLNEDLVQEVQYLPRTIALPYYQVSKRLGRAIPFLSFPDQSSYNMKIRDHSSVHPYVARFDNMDMRWPVFGDRTEIAFLKGCADTSASFQHGPDAIASCQEYVISRDVESLLKEMIRLKEILERMPNAFHSISPNPSSGENYVASTDWTRWGHFSAPLSKRCPAASGLQFPPYLLMDAFLGRKKYDSFLGAEGVHLRAWQPSNLRAFIASVENYYSIPEFVRKSGDARLMGVLDGIVEAYTGERGFMGVHRYKVYGILEVAGKTGRSETNGLSGAEDAAGHPWEETHRQFSAAMKERLEVFRPDSSLELESHEVRGTYAECRYKARILARSHVDNDSSRTNAQITLDIKDTGITFQPGDRLAVMPLNSWGECAKLAAALGLDVTMLDSKAATNKSWRRFADHLQGISRDPRQSRGGIKAVDVLRRGHLAPLNRELVLRVRDMLKASSPIVDQVLASDEWPVAGSLGDLLQSAELDTPRKVWNSAFGRRRAGDLGWLCELIDVEVPRTYSISNYSDDQLPSTVDLTVSRSEYSVSKTLSGPAEIRRAGVSSGFLNPRVASGKSNGSIVPTEDHDEVLVGVSRPVNFVLPLNEAAPCAFFAGGSGIAPFRSFWQNRVSVGRAGTVGNGRNILFYGVQSRSKFSYEQEIRQLVREGSMELHLALSRDSRGLVMGKDRELVDKDMKPRRIDKVIIEHGSTVYDLVMSKKYGGLGGYLYVCGSVSVFDSVISGIRKAIYNRTQNMQTATETLDTAFAERRFMLDVFMTPKPVPGNLPSITLSQLAVHTGHRKDSRIWIAVHSKVYDITDFTHMHPGGRLIIQSNAGVDCTQAFDNLAHTNNPEVSSLLTKYLVGHLTPRPDFSHAKELDGTYSAWSAYLRSAVETLVAHSFEMSQMAETKPDSHQLAGTGTSSWWWQGTGLVNHKSVRSFYKYQSRLLQTGFSALFGPKFQELVLKLSFTLANATSAGAATRLPDVLGLVARAESSRSAAKTAKEIALIGDFVINKNESSRLHVESLIAYATKSVELDISMVEDIRDQVCLGLDAFYTITSRNDLENSPDQTITLLCSYLMQLLERMAKRLEMFHLSLARHSVSQQPMETNPARARWLILRQRIRDRSFFLLAQNPSIDNAKFHTNTNFDSILTSVRRELGTANLDSSPKAGWVPPRPLNGVQNGESQILSNGHRSSTFESHEDIKAMRRMSKFIDHNLKAMRRLSRVPMDFDGPTDTQSQGRVIAQPAMGVSTAPSPDNGTSLQRQDSNTKSPDLVRGLAAANSRYNAMVPQSRTGLPSTPRMSAGGVTPMVKRAGPAPPSNGHNDGHRLIYPANATAPGLDQSKMHVVVSTAIKRDRDSPPPPPASLPVSQANTTMRLARTDEGHDAVADVRVIRDESRSQHQIPPREPIGRRPSDSNLRSGGKAFRMTKRWLGRATTEPEQRTEQQWG